MLFLARAEHGTGTARKSRIALVSGALLLIFTITSSDSRPPVNIIRSPLKHVLLLSVSFPEPQAANYSSEELFGRSREEGQRSTVVTVRACTPSPPPPPSPTQVKETPQTPKLFTPSKISFSVRTFLLPEDSKYMHAVCRQGCIL